MGGADGAARFWELLGEQDRGALRAAGRAVTFADKAVLCLEGEPSTHVFILLSGWVKIISASEDGRELLAGLCGPGDLVGEIAGAVTGYRTATVRAIGTVRALIVAAAPFGAYLDTHREASRAYRTAMAAHQLAAYQVRRDQAASSGAQRLARLLLDLTEQQRTGRSGAARTPGGPGGPAGLPLSQEDLASLIGASRATVTRTLRNWRSRGAVRTGQRHITVLDDTILRRIARDPRASSR
jgi:CRP/FNR family transcriptional regulator, cyclic AMP receptor protein